MKKLIGFDLDDTLAVTKSPISDQMSELLVGLLDHIEVCIISGGKYEQFQRQVVERLAASPSQFTWKRSRTVQSLKTEVVK
jgi:phosphomannomutase